MKLWKITVKEFETDKPLVSYFTGNATRDQLVKFYGLDEPDVEYYNIEEVDEQDI